MNFTQKDFARFRRAVAPFYGFGAFENGVPFVKNASATAIKKIFVTSDVSFALYLTAAHALGGRDYVAFDDCDGIAPRFYPARRIKVDETLDLAAFGVRILSESDSQKLTPFETLSKAPLHFDVVVGGWGSPFRNDCFSLTSGRVIPLDRMREMKVPGAKYECSKFAGVTCSSRSGDSGGAIFDAESGKLAGIVLGTLADDRAFAGAQFASNVCYCCPVENATEFIDDAIKLFDDEIKSIANPQ